MIWKSDRGSRGYHHGNLKEALIRAALELIAAKGPSGFTFAEAARSAGVSPAAPYRHFRAERVRIARALRDKNLGTQLSDGIADMIHNTSRRRRA